MGAQLDFDEQGRSGETRAGLRGAPQVLATVATLAALALGGAAATGSYT
ncbi:MAG: hypothetical protein H0U26_02630, partial [Acidimicrobiia bacterium]|nr:hypothetical protein [Acidimicrobiia bacterium]